MKVIAYNKDYQGYMVSMNNGGLKHTKDEAVATVFDNIDEAANKANMHFPANYVQSNIDFREFLGYIVRAGEIRPFCYYSADGVSITRCEESAKVFDTLEDAKAYIDNNDGYPRLKIGNSIK